MDEEVEVEKWDIAEYAQRMRVLAAESHGDTAQAHEKADDLIVEVLKAAGLEEVSEQYEKVGKWFE